MTSVEMYERTECRKLFVAFVNLSRATPEARWDAHRAEDACLAGEEMVRPGEELGKGRYARS